ncbi:MAG: RNA 2',3'-cyclic phosphodiesterase [Chthonomonadales bacterium]|nr:RNA 2',3'-cyclic phosphodiesterase [Chthonomonadales bacterium]
MRLFFAVLLPEALIERVVEAQRGLRALVGDDGVRWTRTDQFHYTLKFLGEQPTPRAYQAVEAASAVCAARLPFRLALGGVGAFPGAERPSVLWLGATEGAEELVDLARALDGALARQRFPRENRPPRAHLTLARVRSYAGETAAARAVPSARADDVGSMTVDGIALMQSTMRASDSQYTLVERFRFAAGE